MHATKMTKERPRQASRGKNINQNSFHRVTDENPNPTINT